MRIASFTITKERVKETMEFILSLDSINKYRNPPIHREIDIDSHCIDLSDISEKDSKILQDYLERIRKMDKVVNNIEKNKNDNWFKKIIKKCSIS